MLVGRLLEIETIRFPAINGIRYSRGPREIGRGMRKAARLESFRGQTFTLKVCWVPGGRKNMETFVTLSNIAANPAFIARATAIYNTEVVNAQSIPFIGADGITYHCLRPMRADGTPRAPNESGYVQKVVIQPSGAQNRAGIGGMRITAYLHQIAWWRRKRFSPRSVNKRRAKTANRHQPVAMSHLCHNKWCFQKAHIIAEPFWVNVYRERCRLRRGYGDCQCHQSRHGVPNIYRTCLR